jgi:transcriptional regulator with GAF, ATPase, and Fis domain
MDGLEDLLFRLSEAALFSSSLRDRKEDIQLLVEKLVHKYEKQLNARERIIEPEAINKLLGYDWPGNVRELEGYIYKAVKNNPKVPHLVSAHIQFKDRITSDEGSFVPATSEIPSVKAEKALSENKSFEEKQLPVMLAQLRQRHDQLYRHALKLIETRAMMSQIIRRHG